MKNQIIKIVVAAMVAFIVSPSPAQVRNDDIHHANNFDGGLPADIPPELALPDEGMTEQLLQQLEMQYFYLKHLDNVRMAMEKELSIAKIRRECEGLRMVCTGDGLVDLPPPPPSPPEPRAQAPSPEPLPMVYGVAGDGAWIDFRRQRLYVKRGARVGGWSVRRVALDHLVFERGGRRYTVPVQWHDHSRRDKADASNLRNANSEK